MRFFICLLAWLFTQNAWAFKMSLLESTLNLGEGKFSTTATIINNSKNMIAIEAVARVRTYNADGIENFDEEAKNLIIIPNQMIIPADGEQVLNIRWVGPRDIPSERAFRLLVEYVSVSEKKMKGEENSQEAGININYRIAKSFYVAPRGVVANIVLHQAQKTIVDNKKKIRLSLENTGGKHQIIHHLDLQFTTQDNETIDVSFSTKELGQSGVNFLAQEKRNIFLSWPESLQDKEIVNAKIMGFGNQ